MFQQRENHPARHPADNSQVSDQCGQVRPKVASHFGREWGLGFLPVFRTPDPVAPIFGDLRLDGRQFGHLVSQARPPPVSRLPGLSSGLPATLLSAASTLTLFAGKPIGGRRFRRCRRVPLLQTKLPLKIGNLLFGLHQFLVALRQLLPKLLILVLQSLLLTLQPPHVRLCTGCRTSILAAGSTQISSLPGFTPERQV